MARARCAGSGPVAQSGQHPQTWNSGVQSIGPLSVEAAMKAGGRGFKSHRARHYPSESTGFPKYSLAKTLFFIRSFSQRRLVIADSTKSTSSEPRGSSHRARFLSGSELGLFQKWQCRHWCMPSGPSIGHTPSPCHPSLPGPTHLVLRLEEHCNVVARMQVNAYKVVSL